MTEVRFSPGDPEVFAAGLLGVIDAGDGGTDEQHAVLQAIVRHVWQVPDLDLDGHAACAPGAVATRLTEPAARLRFCELAMVLELCRHPQSAAQVERVEEYVTALGVDGVAVETTRTALERGAAIATEDLERTYREILPEISELTLRDRYLTLDAPDPALGDRLRALHDLPPRHARPRVRGVLPAQRVPPARRRRAPPRALREPRHEPRDHRLRAHGARRGRTVGIPVRREHEPAQLARAPAHAVDPRVGRAHPRRDPGQGGHPRPPRGGRAPREGLERGEQCTVDLPSVDHLAIAAEPLEEIRARFHVVPLRHPRAPTDA